MSLKHRGLLRVADPAPSKGPRRPGHHGHKPANVVPFEKSSVKVVRMFEALQERGWTFRFQAEATSPRGFKYTAEGDSPLEAFLKAFGQWQRELGSWVPKIPKLVQAQKPLPRVKPKRVSKLSADLLGRLRELRRSQGRAVYFKVRQRLIRHPDWTFEHALRWEAMSKIAGDKTTYRRLYMRAYRRQPPRAELVAV